MTILDFIRQLSEGGMAGWVIGAIILFLSLIQISPMKLNPWDKILGWFGAKLNGSQEQRLKELDKRVSDLWINTHRQTLLTFARECRSEIQHSESEWANILNVARDYEVYVETHNIANGVVRADTEYIRNLYQELSREHRI